MQALFFTGQSDLPLEWQETEQPEIQNPGDAIIRPIAVAACDLDKQIINGHSPFPGPFALGHEFTGEIVELGDEVRTFNVGDKVLASFQPSCGQCYRCHRMHSSVCETVGNGTMYGIGQTGGDWGGAIADFIRVPWADFNLIKVPDQCDARAIASAADNLADGLRGVDKALTDNPGASVLIAGAGSIPLYAIVCAQFLGAGEVTFASADETAMEVADSLGANCLPVERWPDRFRSHDITVDCTGSVSGLASVLRSTAPYGISTSSSIFFNGDVPVPMFNMNMRGITFNTGRVNSASDLSRVMELLSGGLDPNRIKPAYYSFDDAIEGLRQEPLSRKVIVHRNADD